jgi:O-antigen ligase
MTSRKRRFSRALSVLLLLSSVASGFYSAYWFIQTETAKSESRDLFQALQQGGIRNADGSITLGGPTPRGFVILAGVFEMKKKAWKGLSFTLAMAIAAYLLLGFSRGVSMPRPQPALPVEGTRAIQD